MMLMLILIVIKSKGVDTKTMEMHNYSARYFVVSTGPTSVKRKVA